MHPTIQLALRAVRSVRENYEYVLDRLDIARKDNALAEYLSNCGSKVEQNLARQLVRSHPDASFVGLSHKVKGEGPLSWHVNPLLGSSNLSRGYPAFALSVAIYFNGKLEHVIIYNPATEQEFMASRGRGATLNERRIRVLSGWPQDNASLAFPLPLSQSEQLIKPYQNLVALLANQQILSSGCPALDICALAAGQLNAVILLGANVDELAPALLILKEAGGLHGDLNGAPQFDKQGRLLAANPKAFRLLVNQLKPALD